MNTISIEVIPRTKESLVSDLTIIKKFARVSLVNIPDLLSCHIRSWEAAEISGQFYGRVIPHIRAIDINPHERHVFIEKIKISKVKEMLIVNGDMPQQYNRAVYSTTTLQAIEWCREEIPYLRIYGGIDQYRSGLKKELSYAKEKLSAGASGFFTQPFFDIRFMEIWAELLSAIPVYWGVAPVTSIKAKEGYWETKNNVVFPAGFDASLSWNQCFANEVLEWIGKTQNHHVYFMPIKVDLASYFSGIFL